MQSVYMHMHIWFDTSYITHNTCLHSPPTCPSSGHMTPSSIASDKNDTISDTKFTLRRYQHTNISICMHDAYKYGTRYLHMTEMNHRIKHTCHQYQLSGRRSSLGVALSLALSLSLTLLPLLVPPTDEWNKHFLGVAHNKSCT